MKNIKIVYERLIKTYVGIAKLPILVFAQNILICLFVLIFLNIIVSNGKTNGRLNYTQIKNFYNLCMFISFFIITIFAPYFLGKSINSYVKNNNLDYLLGSYIKYKELVFATFLWGFLNVFILLFSTFPITCVSLFFGGVGPIKILLIICCYLCFLFVISSMSIFLSSFINEINLSFVLSYIFSFILFFLQIIFIKFIISQMLFITIYIIIMMTISLIFLNLAMHNEFYSA